MAPDSASSTRTSATKTFVPRRSSSRNVQANNPAIIKAVNSTTPFSPAALSSQPTTTSYSHSQANQGWLPVTEEVIGENGSVRGISCVARISCPVRICQPIPASPNKRTDRGVNTSRLTSTTKSKSPADGTSHRTHAGCEPAAELLESIAIALNLIEWEPDRQENERQDGTSSSTSRRGCGSGLRWAKRCPGAGWRICKHDRDRSEKSSYLSTASLSGGDCRSFSRRDRCSYPIDSAAS